MSIFVVVAQSDSGPSGSLVGSIQASGVAKYPLKDGVWLISRSGTARELCTTLGIVGGEYGTAVVTEVASYFGRANPAIWSWIKQNWEGEPLA